MHVYRQQLTSQAAITSDGDGALVQVLPRNVVFFLNCTVLTAGSLDVTIEAQDPVSGVWTVIDTFAQLVAPGSERRVFNNLFESNLRASFDVVTGPATFTVSVQGKEGDADG